LYPIRRAEVHHQYMVVVVVDDLIEGGD